MEAALTVKLGVLRKIEREDEEYCRVRWSLRNLCFHDGDHE